MSVEKAITTIKEMFEQRNYSDISEDKDGEQRILAKKPNGDQIVCILDFVTTKFNIENMQDKYEQLKEQGIKHCIIIYNDTPTPAVKKEIPNLEKIGMRFELFQLDDLQFNCTKHSLVPKHELLSPEESKTFKDKYGSNIPVLLHTDPIAKFYNFRPGQIIRVVRRNGFPSYRIVK
jgi:DNA-directed RNA polymerase subunit H (RpoH/RPB5)